MNKGGNPMYRKRYPVYHNGREIITVSRRSKKGEAILARAARVAGYTLFDCYSKPSALKGEIYRECYEMFLQDVDAHGFHITSYNVNQFSVSWTTAGGLVVLLTRDYEYLVTD